jgi:RimJ/RimL family protein N-acetyltransferase
LNGSFRGGIRRHVDYLMTKRHIDPIAGRRVRLRLLAEADLPMTLAWRNRDHIRRWFINSDRLTAEQHHAWFEQYAGRDDDFVFIVEEAKELLKPVGQVSLYKIDWGLGRAELGRILIGEPGAAGKGLAKEATRLLLDHAFGQFKLREVEANVMSTNRASLAVFSCGFREVEERDGLKRFICEGRDLNAPEKADRAAIKRSSI